MKNVEIFYSINLPLAILLKLATFEQSFDYYFGFSVILNYIKGNISC